MRYMCLKCKAVKGSILGQRTAKAIGGIRKKKVRVPICCGWKMAEITEEQYQGALNDR